MLINDKIKELNISLYRLSKISGIPQSTLSDISIGKSKLLDCNGKTLLSLAKILQISIETLLEFEQLTYKPEFETNIPLFLKEALSNLKKSIRYNSDLLDCYLLEVNSSINVCEVENMISKEHAYYLRNKYL